MDKDYEKKLADQAGLAYGGINDKGNQEFLGTRQQWEEFERLKDEDLEKRGLPDFEHTYPDSFSSEQQEKTGESYK